MSKRTDIRTIMVLGSGPIVIGQGCEFDYSGVQACKVLRREGYRIVLVNSNPATIMTDPEFADATYVEPLTPEICERIIEAEKPDAILPTVAARPRSIWRWRCARPGFWTNMASNSLARPSPVLNWRKTASYLRMR